MRWPPKLNRPYRPCVGIMMLNQDKKIFIAKRIDHPSNAWQMPQGGILDHEPPEQAVFRELKEEIGTNNAKILAVASKEYKYDLPAPLYKKVWDGKYRGQTQRWFLLSFEGTDEEINIHTAHPEFSEWRWAEASELLKLAVHFKRPVYGQILHEFKEYL
ncbi:MAG: RNA pyrophosphohydrolase [Alphaproteobacteria bacterium]|nr:RNA pyrophosphohydrolase [Alphaproteobacteria bacterium]